METGTENGLENGLENGMENGMANGLENGMENGHFDHLGFFSRSRSRYRPPLPLFILAPILVLGFAPHLALASPLSSPLSILIIF